MANFKAAIGKILSNEGGYVNNLNDKGGETYKGIARKRNPQWKGWSLIDHFKQVLASNDWEKRINEHPEFEILVEEFYKAEFWDHMKLDQVQNQVIAVELFDTGVNMGCGKAVQFLQIALNLLNKNEKLYADMKVDGLMGPSTLKALNDYPEPYAISIAVNGEQYNHYKKICESDPTQEEFMKGWILKRVGFKID